MITLLTSGIPSRSHIHFTELDIELACTERSSTSSADASLLKFCRKELRRPLSLLWKPTLDHGYIPPDLLLVLVCPVHKGGRRFTPKNYRPLALTSHIIRIFERVVRKALVAHLEKHCLLPDDQHEFRALRSTPTQLLVYWDTLLEIPA